ncbi:mycothiol transferase [Streptomyces sp. NPDC004685]
MEIWPAWRLPDVRHVLIHVLAEVACHSGHLDAVRELIGNTSRFGGSLYPG